MKSHNTANEYVYSVNIHNLTGPASAVRVLFHDERPGSVLDVGCGTGTWLRVLADMGVVDYLGIDAANYDKQQFYLPKSKFRQINLGEEWNLNRSFDIALCLEVAEHLSPEAGHTLIRCLVKHTNFVVFSAACPGQAGQQHINCQWPDYWQNLFNREGFSCSDHIRWKIWNDSRIECWYRQNIFIARRNPGEASREPRIQPVVHPDMAYGLFANSAAERALERVQQGLLPIRWYTTAPVAALWLKAFRALRRFHYTHKNE